MGKSFEEAVNGLSTLPPQAYRFLKEEWTCHSVAKHEALTIARQADALIKAQKELIELYATNEDDGWPVDIHERERLRAEIVRLER